MSAPPANGAVAVRFHRHRGKPPRDVTTFNAELGYQLRSLRVGRFLTLQDVERLTSGAIKYTVLGSWERGERNPPFRRLVQLASVYGVGIEQLVPGTTPPPATHTAQCPHCRRPITLSAAPDDEEQNGTQPRGS